MFLGSAVTKNWGCFWPSQSDSWESVIKNITIDFSFNWALRESLFPMSPLVFIIPVLLLSLDPLFIKSHDLARMRLSHGRGSFPALRLPGRYRGSWAFLVSFSLELVACLQIDDMIPCILRSCTAIQARCLQSVKCYNCVCIWLLRPHEVIKK